MLNKNKSVSLSKGQSLGESSPSSSVLKNIMSLRSVQYGVSPDYVSKSCADNSTDSILNKNNPTASSTANVEEAVWFLMRAAYGKEKKAKDFLEAKGIKTFLPLQTQTYIYKGKKKHRQVSLIPNFLFVKSSEEEMKQYIGKGELDFFHHYYVPHKDDRGRPLGKNGIKPLVIPTCQMESFIRWNEISDDNKLFVADDKIKFAKNDVVKIVDGKFAGLEGYVCRIKGQSRIGIVVNGVGTIFTAYIPKCMLKKV